MEKLREINGKPHVCTRSASHDMPKYVVGWFCHLNQLMAVDKGSSKPS
jgi:hypothetical protein